MPGTKNFDRRFSDNFFPQKILEPILDLGFRKFKIKSWAPKSKTIFQNNL